MFGLLKQIIIFFYLLFVRSSKRNGLLRSLLSNYKKHKFDNPVLPAALDDVTQLSERWQDSTSFVGFDEQGVCIHITAERTHDNYHVSQIKLDLPGYGHFSYKDDNWFKQDINKDKHFGGSRLKVICLSTMKRWKIYFRGPLNAIINGKHTHATVSLYWQCFFDPIDHFLSPSCWNLAHNLSSLAWKDICFFPVVLDGIASYDQWGELRGRINIAKFEELRVRLKCIRNRTFKHQHSDTSMFQRVFRQHLVVKESGLSFSNQVMKIGNRLTHTAFISFPIGDSRSARLQNIATKHDCQTIGEIKYPLIISACNMLYDVSENLTRRCFSDQNPNFRFSTLSINGRKGFGVIYSFDSQYKAENFKEHKKERLESSFDNVSELLFGNEELAVVNLDEPLCKIRSLVGGKAYRLSVLSALKKFNVPNGICLSTKAFQSHIQKNNALQNCMAEIKDCLKSSENQILKQKCDEGVKLFQQTPLSEELQSLVRKHLHDVFGQNKWQTIKFAVRSSSISEDSCETSTAGQLDTYLCVQGFDNIMSSIQHCWASSVSYKVVEYRRQNGQELLESLGVVVQEMVDADVAGVLFTVDPVTGNESNMVINANYGLGESVVSGTVNPDTIVVSRGDEGKLQIKEIHIGSKETRIVAGEADGTILESVSDAEKNSACIHDTDINRISEHGIEIENCLGSPQDIEWAIAKGVVYTLQSRPVSVLDIETDEELIHEFDSPVVSERELVTPCNLEEQLQGAVTTLTGDLVASAVDKACSYHVASRLGIQFPTHALSSVVSFSGLLFLTLTGWAVKDICGIMGDKGKPNTEVGIIGQPVQEHTLNDVKEFYGRKISIWTKISKLTRELLVLNRRDCNLYDKIINTTETLSVGTDCESSQKLYECIDENIILYFDMWKAFLFECRVNVNAYSGVIAILIWKSKEVSMEHLADMALLLSSCKTLISAEIPRFVHDLSKRIAKSDFKDQFLDTSLENCDSFLRNSDDASLRSDYISFMERHGHRGTRESEFMEKSWSQDPRGLMHAVKLIISKGSFQEKNKTCQTISELVDSLQTNMDRFQKMLLKTFLVQKTIDGINGRELAKSYMTKVTHIFKQAYWRLAEMMVRESRLPEPDLLFFLTHGEIGELIKHRSSKLVRLSKRRRRILPEMNKLKYPKVNFGLPQPVQKENPKCQQLPSLTLQGMPVGRGRAEGRACVINSVTEAGRLSERDVLICKYTDASWTAYFPLISGLVTERGGLLSHGAVIAREYGIPCIVNTTDATEMIVTGDNVVLDGTAGTISKVSR